MGLGRTLQGLTAEAAQSRGVLVLAPGTYKTPPELNIEICKLIAKPLVAFKLAVWEHLSHTGPFFFSLWEPVYQHTAYRQGSGWHSSVSTTGSCWSDARGYLITGTQSPEGQVKIIQQSRTGMETMGEFVTVLAIREGSGGGGDAFPTW